MSKTSDVIQINSNHRYEHPIPKLFTKLFSAPRTKKRHFQKTTDRSCLKYMTGILLNNKCHVYCINGVENHIHIICHLHPSVGLHGWLKISILASSAFIKEKNLFKNFIGWQVGYSAFTFSIKEKGRLIAYVNDQEQHHNESHTEKNILTC